MLAVCKYDQTLADQMAAPLCILGSPSDQGIIQSHAWGCAGHCRLQFHARKPTPHTSGGFGGNCTVPRNSTGTWPS